MSGYEPSDAVDKIVTAALRLPIEAILDTAELSIPDRRNLAEMRAALQELEAFDRLDRCT